MAQVLKPGCLGSEISSMIYGLRNEGLFSVFKIPIFPSARGNEMIILNKIMHVKCFT